MAYINLDNIGSTEARDIIVRDPALAQLALDKATDDVDIEANSHEVKVEDILLDETSSNLVSKELKRFCEERFLYHIFRFCANVVDLDDEYTKLMMQAELEASKLESKISYAVIVKEEVVDQSERNTGIDIL